MRTRRPYPDDLAPPTHIGTSSATWRGLAGWLLATERGEVVGFVRAGSTRQVRGTTPATYRDALIFTELEGLTQTEMGQRLGLSTTGARRLMRGTHSTMLENSARVLTPRCGEVLGKTVIDLEALAQ